MANLCGLLKGRPKKEEAIEGEFEEINVPRGTFMSRTEAADKAGVSVKTMERAMKVDRNGSPRGIVSIPLTINPPNPWPRRTMAPRHPSLVRRPE